MKSHTVCAGVFILLLLGAACGLLFAGISLKRSYESTKGFNWTECSSNVTSVTQTSCKITAMTVDVHTGRRVRLQYPPVPGAECFLTLTGWEEMSQWLVIISAGRPTAVIGCYVEEGNKTISIGVLQRADRSDETVLILFAAIFLAVAMLTLLCVAWPLVRAACCGFAKLGRRAAIAVGLRAGKTDEKGVVMCSDV